MTSLATRHGAGTPLLRLDGLVAGHERPLSPPCSLELARGEIVGLHGPNGAGKSTLLAAIVGSARRHAGTLWLATGLRLRHLAQNPQRPHAPVSGRELLAWLDARALTPPPRLAACLARRIDRLSGGEYQLLCLWACIAGDADLVLLDEPTNHLDQTHVDVAVEEIVTARERRGVLIVSHDRAFLRRLDARVVQVVPR
jgi:zinc transport system ATP-binding protein